jgi:hypothetical protein
VDWQAKLAWGDAEHERRLASVAGPDEREDFRLAAIAGASWAAGLAALMLGRDDEARDRLFRAADEYDTSWRAAPPGSWGRPIAMIRCRLMAGDHDRARVDASAAVGGGALDAPGPIGGYCAALALLVLGRDEDAEVVAARVADEGLDPAAVAEALGALARGDGPGYAAARLAVLRSFEARDAFLEDVPVADTVLVLDALALERGLDLQPLSSPLLPGYMID